MKTFIYLLVFLNFSILFAADELPFTYESLRNDFNGVTFNSSVIITYGTGCTVVRSTDRGVTWEQNYLAHDSLSIMKIRNINDNFYGVLDKSLIIKSVDDGKSWQVKPLAAGPDVRDLDYSDNLLYILRNGTVDILDLDLNLKSSFNIDTAFHPNGIHVFNDIIYTPLDSGKIATYDINNDYKPGVIDFSELGLCTDCNKMNRIMDNGKEVFAAMRAKVFKSGDDGQTWSLVNDKLSFYNFHNDTIYDLKQENYTKDYLACRLCLNKLENDSLLRITKDQMPKRLTTYIMPTDYAFISNDTIIVVGRDKLIFMSFDGGSTWEMKSHLRGGGSMFWIDSLTCYSIGDFGAIYKTTNAGVTWIGQRFTDLNAKRFSSIENFYIENSGRGLIFTYQFDNALSNFLITLDSGNTFKEKRIEGFNDWKSSFGSPYLIKKDSVYYFYTNKQNSDIYTRTNIVVLDSMFNFVRSIKVDSILMFNVQKLADNRFVALGLFRRYSKDGFYYDSTAYSVMCSDDGLKWRQDFKLDVPDDDLVGLNMSYVFRDLMLFNCRKLINDRTHNFLLMADLKNRKTHELMYGDTMTRYTRFINFGGWTFCGSARQMLYYNKDIINNPFQWDSISFRPFNIVPFYNQGKIAYVYADDLVKRKVNILRLRLKDGTSVVETPVEEQAYLYAFPAYPQPARDIVSSRVYWDNGYDINDADINVYDVTGQKISGKENITLSKSGNTSGILNWSCRDVADGIYLIRIRLGGTTKTIRAAVIK
jgi:photosystem II stability/assembly factor-like uncharacterized protein